MANLAPRCVVGYVLAAMGLMRLLDHRCVVRRFSGAGVVMIGREDL